MVPVGITRAGGASVRLFVDENRLSPLFIFVGTIAYQLGIATRLYDFARYERDARLMPSGLLEKRMGSPVVRHCTP